MKSATAERTQHFPPFAPTFGVAAVTKAPVHLGEVSAEPEPRPRVQRSRTPGAVLTSSESIPEALLSMGVTGLSGGLTGALAADSWQGGAIGAGTTMALWSGWNLLAAWRSLGPGTRVTLGVGALVGGASAAALYLRRRR